MNVGACDNDRQHDKRQVKNSTRRDIYLGQACFSIACLITLHRSPEIYSAVYCDPFTAIPWFHHHHHFRDQHPRHAPLRDRRSATIQTTALQNICSRTLTWGELHVPGYDSGIRLAFTTSSASEDCEIVIEALLRVKTPIQPIQKVYIWIPPSTMNID
jgi:hypothetical protein